MKNVDRINLSYFVLAISTFVLVILSQLGFFNPLYSFSKILISDSFSRIEEVSGVVNRGIAGVSSLQSIQLENDRLRNENADLSFENLQLTELREENRYLKSELNIFGELEQPSELLRVLRYESYPAPGYLSLESVSGSLVQVGDWVASRGYLIGEIVEVNGRVVRVRLIVADGFEVPVSIGDSEVVGKAVGSAGIDVYVEGVSVESKITNGEAIKVYQATNPILEKYKVGQTESVVKDELSGVYQIKVFSPIIFQSLDYVLLVSSR